MLGCPADPAVGLMLSGLQPDSGDSRVEGGEPAGGSGGPLTRKPGLVRILLASEDAEGIQSEARPRTQRQSVWVGHSEGRCPHDGPGIRAAFARLALAHGFQSDLTTRPCESFTLDGPQHVPATGAQRSPLESDSLAKPEVYGKIGAKM